MSKTRIEKTSEWLITLGVIADIFCLCYGFYFGGGAMLVFIGFVFLCALLIHVSWHDEHFGVSSFDTTTETKSNTIKEKDGKK